LKIEIMGDISFFKYTSGPRGHMQYGSREKGNIEDSSVKRKQKKGEGWGKGGQLGGYEVGV
jgi:hypothetical protein